MDSRVFAITQRSRGYPHPMVSVEATLGTTARHFYPSYSGKYPWRPKVKPEFPLPLSSNEESLRWETWTLTSTWQFQGNSSQPPAGVVPERENIARDINKIQSLLTPKMSRIQQKITCDTKNWADLRLNEKRQSIHADDKMPEMLNYLTNILEHP